LGSEGLERQRRATTDAFFLRNEGADSPSRHARRRPPQARSLGLAGTRSITVDRSRAAKESKLAVNPFATLDDARFTQLAYDAGP
jgi:hypothetical protein